MEYQEALDRIKNKKEFVYCEAKPYFPLGIVQVDVKIDLEEELAEELNVLQQAVDKANKYDEKETPKKVEIIEDFDERGISYKTYLCGVSQNVLSNTNSRYCPNCGQRLEFKNE